MNKLTKKQIDLIRSHTPADLKGKQMTISQTLGYFQPCEANWAYLAGWTHDGNLIVTRFGEVM